MIPGKTLAEQGLSLPPVRRDSAAGAAPQRRLNWLGPRFEPSNLSSNATIQSLQTAVREAENGETTSLFRLYRDELLGDDHVQGELNKRKLAVLGQPMAVLPEDKRNEADVLAAAVCLRAIADCDNWNSGMAALLSSTAVYPVTMAENIFAPATKPVPWRLESDSPEAAPRLAATQYTLKRIEPVNPMLFCFRHAYLIGGVGIGSQTPVQNVGLGMSSGQTTDWFNLNDWEPFLKLWPTDESGRIIYDASRATKLDPGRHIVYRGHLLAEHKDNWGGPGRAILGWWLLRGLGRDWFARFMERYGSPFPVGKTNVQDEQAVALLQQAFSLATKIGGLVIGQEDSVELEQAAVAGGAEGHEKWHNVCNNAISRHICGQDMGASTGQATGLGSGLSDAKENIRQDIRILDQKTLGEMLIKQLFRNLLAYNGISGSIRVVWGGLSSGDAKTFADLLKTLKDAGWEPVDEAIPGVSEKLGVQVRRAAAAPMPDINAKAQSREGAKEDREEDPTETFSAREFGLLTPLGVKDKAADPVDAVLAGRLAGLSASYKGAMAPFRQAILTSSSREECLRKLTAAYADWSPGRLQDELETALQIAAAAGVKAAVDKKPKS